MPDLPVPLWAVTAGTALTPPVLPHNLRIATFAVSAFFTGIGGGVYAHYIYEDLDTVQQLPLSMGVAAFTKDKAAAPAQAAALAARKLAAMISVEASGANAQGVPNIAIGDLGNEIGMGTIADHIVKYVPFTGKGECQCG